MVEIRLAREADRPAMAAIQSAALRAGGSEVYTDEQLAHLAPEPRPAVIPVGEAGSETVVAAAGEVIGWGSVNLADGVLTATYVHPDHARGGVGRRLVGRLERTARESGVERLTAYAARNAVGFYERLGYERRTTVDVADEPDAPRVPGVEMTKRLGDATE